MFVKSKRCAHSLELGNATTSPDDALEFVDAAYSPECMLDRLLGILACGRCDCRLDEQTPSSSSSAKAALQCLAFMSFDFDAMCLAFSQLHFRTPTLRRTYLRISMWMTPRDASHLPGISELVCACARGRGIL